MDFVHRKNSIRLFGSLILACAIGLFSVPPAQSGSANDMLLKPDGDVRKLSQRLELLLPIMMKDECVPGMAIGLIDNGELVWARGFGVRDVKTKQPVTTRTVFEAASLSKPVFSYAVLRMSERGDIDIDKPLYEYVGCDYVENDDRIRLITARMVLSHTSGFEVFGGRGRKPRILYQPGGKFLYSTAAYIYLQRVIEHITGLPLNKIMEKEVFGPLGMSRSSYTWRDIYDAQIAVGHDWDGRPCQKRKWTKGCAAYSLYTTLEDYGRFICAILNRTGSKQHSRNEMLSKQITVPTNRQDPDSEGHSSLAWGLGVGLLNSKYGKGFWQWGDNGQFKCYFIIYVNAKVGVVYFNNSHYGLSVLDSVLNKTLGSSNPTVEWLGYSEHYSSWSIIRAQRKAFYKLKKRYWKLYRKLRRLLSGNPTSGLLKPKADVLTHSCRSVRTH